MTLKHFQVTALCLTIVVVAGCTGTMPKRRVVERPPTITEEDLKTDMPAQPADRPPAIEGAAPPVSSQQDLPPSVGGSPEPRQFTEPSERPSKRYYKWEDKRGGQRGWQPAEPRR